MSLGKFVLGGIAVAAITSGVLFWYSAPQAKADVHYKKVLQLLDGNTYTVGAEGVREITRQESWVLVETGNGNVDHFAREQVKYFQETPTIVPE